MSFCPRCEEEYRPEFAVCPECRVALVSSLEKEPGEIEDLAVAVTVHQEETAYILRGFLENEGIPCQLENLAFHAEPIPVGGLTKVRLWTKKSDAARAQELIAAHEQFSACSSCGHVILAQDTVCDFCGEALDLE